MVAKSKSPTTKDIGLLWQLHSDGQLKLQPEFQRESVWPLAAKSYLIDTILNERPIPLFFLQRDTSIQTGRSEYSVIDGQQRLRAIFDYINDEFPLGEVSEKSVAKKHKGKKFSELPKSFQQIILNYDLVVQELFGYTDEDVRDIFARMNKYVVRLSKQELRHAQTSGKFKELVEKLGKWPYWVKHKIVTASQLKRMKNVEFTAELIILLSEGAQDKKTAIDLYYHQYQKSFPAGSELSDLLKTYIDWIEKTLPSLSKSRFRRTNEFYSLIGALDKVSVRGTKLHSLNEKKARDALIKFEKRTASGDLTGDESRYVIAASKHADDITPRTIRIEILSKLLSA